ncbi:metallophosphoesterase [Weeksellaceae bacterium A-14]
MKILHISDLHFSSLQDNEYTLKKVVEKIVTQSKNEKIDFILFTGDLVFKGDNIDTFYEAQILLFDELSSKLGIKPNNIIFCCGNHDVHRNQEIGVVTEKIDKITKEKDLDSFVSSEQTKKEFQNSLSNINNFITFQKDYFKKEVGNELNELYSIHSRECDGKKIGIVTINSSWRCNSDKDFGNLLFPNKFVENISLKLKDFDFKILLIHHPLGELKWWNKTLIENKIYEDFHLMLLGHIHKGIQTAIPKNDEGIITSSSTAVLSAINEFEKIGFSIINIDIDINKINFDNYNIDSDFVLYKTNSYAIDIPVAGEKQDYIELRKKISQLYEAELENGNDLFINNINGKKSFFDKFSKPVLKSKSSLERNDVTLSDRNIQIDIDELLSDFSKNRVFYGKDKYGKSIILYYLYLNILNKFSEVKTIPVFLNETANNVNNFTVEKYVRKNFELKSESVDFLFENYKIIFLIDDFSKITDAVKYEIENFLNDNPESKVILTEDEGLYIHNKINFGNLNFDKIFIHELSSKEVRELTTSSLNCTEELTNELLVKIRTLFTQLNLNFNFWTVSLFIWIFNKSESSVFRNNFELTQLYIDNLLDREKIVAEKSLKIEYPHLKDFLASLAHYLVKEKYQTTYHLSYKELVDFITTYKANHSRFIITVEDLLSVIIGKGILKHNKDNDLYSFRLKGVFEYFIAFYMSENIKFRDDVINSREFYLSFSNELELYAGFKQKDEEFVNKIYQITQEYYSDLNKMYEGTNTDTNLVSKIGEIKLIESSNIRRGIKNQIEKGSDEIVDELADRKAMNQNVTQKKYQEVIKNSEQLEKALFTMCRVFRNSGFANQKLENEILDFVLQSACNLSFLIIDEKNNEGGNDESILGMFKNFTPMMVQNFLFEAIAQENLQEIFEKKIDELKSKGNEELKLFALYFILVDLDFNSNKKYISEMTKIAKLNIIKYGVLFKLYTYLIFNKTGDKDFIRKSALEQQRRIDNSAKAIDGVQKALTHFEKISVGNKRKEMNNSKSK